MDKVLASQAFVNSGRMARFLRFTVERYLEGRAGELKEYLLGVEVFDRGGSYDPRVDPIVRVEARRLRSKLRQYYEKAGAGDELRIEFPTGGYAPTVRRHVAAAEGAPAPAPGGYTIAVLPFSNLSPDPGNDYFSDGLTEELIHGLTKLPGLRVLAWNSAARLRGRDGDVAAVRERLKATTILTGSVRKAGRRLRVTANLVDSSTGVYLWSEAYDSGLEDIFLIQEEISRAIVNTLRLHFRDGAIVRGADDLAAYNLCLKGRFYWNKRSPEGLLRSIECYEQAIRIDPRSALAHAALADSYCLLAEYGISQPSENLARAKAAAARALELDPARGEAYTTLANIRALYEWQWEEAEKLYLRSIELNPGYATAHHWYGTDYLIALGRFAEAAEHIRIARGLDPLSTIILDAEAYLYMLSGEWNRAIALDREALDMDPVFYRAYTAMGRAYSLKGDYDEAVRMFEKGRSIAGDIPHVVAALGQVHALAGRTAEARAMLACLEESSRAGNYVPSTSFAIVLAALGENSRALDRLEGGCQRKDLTLGGLKVHPVYDNLRAEPRFQAILRRIFGEKLTAPPR